MTGVTITCETQDGIEVVYSSHTLNGCPAEFADSICMAADDLQYEGLWHEAEGDAAGAEAALVAATNTEYGCMSPDYMTAVAKVHCRQRGWPTVA